MRHRGEKPLPGSTAAIGAVKDRVVLLFQVRGSFDGHSADYDLPCLVDLLPAESEMLEQGEPRTAGLVRPDAEPRVSLVPEYPWGEGEIQVEDARKGGLNFA